MNRTLALALAITCLPLAAVAEPGPGHRRQQWPSEVWWPSEIYWHTQGRAP